MVYCIRCLLQNKPHNFSVTYEADRRVSKVDTRLSLFTPLVPSIPAATWLCSGASESGLGEFC